jgi:hypothetical protein
LIELVDCGIDARVDHFETLFERPFADWIFFDSEPPLRSDGLLNKHNDVVVVSLV